MATDEEEEDGKAGERAARVALDQLLMEARGQLSPNNKWELWREDPDGIRSLMDVLGTKAEAERLRKRLVARAEDDQSFEIVSRKEMLERQKERKG